MINQLILQRMSYSSYYELFVIRTKLLSRSLRQNQDVSRVWARPLVTPREERMFTSYNTVWENFVKPTVVRNVFLREDLPRKTRLFFIQMNFIAGHSGDDFVIHAYNRSMFMSADNPAVTPFVNVYKFFKKWLHTYDFMLNLFFSQTCVLMFAPKAMKEEAVAFN